MTAISPNTGLVAGPHHQLPVLVGHQFHADLRCYLRNTQSVVFTLLLPVLFLVILASIFRNATVKVPGGTIKESVYYVPGLIAYGLIMAAFSNLALSVVRNRESGIYKRRRATPLPASAVIVGAAAFCCLGFAAASLIRNVNAVQPVIWVTVLPLCFISGIFIPISALPAGLAYISYVFPVHPLAAALLEAYNPYTAGSGLNWGYLAILAAWGAAGLIIAVRRFSWLPRGG